MTVIAWDGKTLAGDSAGCYGDLMCKPYRKVFVVRSKCAQKYLIGVAGHADLVRPTLSYIASNEAPDGWPRFDSEFIHAMKDLRQGETFSGFLLVNRNGVCYVYENWLGTRKIQDGGYMAIGNGFEIAHGALFVGACATNAVAAAIEHNTHCDRPIVSMTVRDIAKTSVKDMEQCYEDWI